MTTPEASLPAPTTARAVVVAVAWSLLFYLVGFLLSVLFASGIGLFFATADNLVSFLSQPGLAAILVQAIATLSGFGLMTWAIGLKGNRLTLEDLRWRVAQPRLAGAGVGLVVGAVAAGLALLLAFGAGGARVTPDSGSFGDYLGRVSLTVLALAPAAFGEELMFRGVPLVLLARPLGRRGALVLTSVLFAMAHARNPDVGTLALINIGVAGLFLGAMFYLPGGIWTSFGAHLAWNATLAAADAPVSGLGLAIPWINYSPGGPDWLTGAGFGPEGGLVATVALLLGLFWSGKRTTREGT
ncbi:MAG TPA: type II CAAX endopeptidase family protein [Gemmatimonadales bacterium]|nr:type II CAAX endopeptidase family protein [Gemmatimonadales bacterium]